MTGCLNLTLAGFGGQGILFAGKLIAEAALIDGREVSWLPSYGPEMRGGTANCSVCLSDEPIGSPLVLRPDALIVMNQPSLHRYLGGVVPGGVVIVDATMVRDVPTRDEIVIFQVAATQLAEDNSLKGLANVILLGKLLKEIRFCRPESLDTAIQKSVLAKRAHLLEPNRKALALGMGS